MKKVLILVALLFGASGCVSKKQLVVSYDEGYTQGHQEKASRMKKLERYIQLLKKDLDAKNKRLDKFNQIDEANRLRNKDTCADSPDGDEDWMK